MKEVDYIIVGLGIAGLAFAEQLQQHGKSFVVFDGTGSGATEKSGGILNPTVLKRFTATWKAEEFFQYAIPFYDSLSHKLNLDVFVEKPVFRIFKSVEEQNNWAVASDKKELEQFLSSETEKNTNASINAPLGFGMVKGTGMISPRVLLDSYRKHLHALNSYFSEEFNYGLVQETQNGISYKEYSVSKIIFSEGASAKDNPSFQNNTLIGNKGEYIIIKAPELKFENLLKGPMYVIPLGNDEYKVGATYARDDYSLEPTLEAREEILSKLKTFINCPIELIGQTVGIRPTTRDRKPLLGNLSESKNKIFFNGLGTRGFLMAPLLAEILYNYLEQGAPLPKEIDIQRFQ